MSRTIVLKEKKDFLTSTTLNAFAEVPDATTIPTNSFSWNDSLKAIRINDQSTDFKGSIHVGLGNLAIGDTVEVSCEVMSISGVKPKLTVDSNAMNTFIQASKTHEFETLHASFIKGASAPSIVVIGVYTADKGDFYLRNVEIKINGSGEKPVSYKKTIKQFSFLMTNGVPVLQTNNSYDSCNVTVDSSTNDIILNYSEPFTGTRNGTVYATISAAGDNPPAVNGYILKTRSESRTGVRIRVYDTQTGNFVNPSTITYMWFHVTHFGFDSV